MGRGKGGGRNKTPARILGVDPGTQKAGYAVITDEPTPKVIEHGTIDLGRKQPLQRRLHRLHRELLELARRHRPEAVAVEEPFVGKSAKSAIAVGQAQAAALIAAAEAGATVHKYAPATVKQSVTNSGAASKDDVSLMVQIILGLGEKPGEDAADALAVALCHLGKQQEERATGQEDNRKAAERKQRTPESKQEPRRRRCSSQA